MSYKIIYVKSFNKNVDANTFFEEISKCKDISQNFCCSRLDESAIRDILRDYISKNGISSLFHFSLTCDAVLHGGIHVDEIEEVILGFIRKLNGVENLFIIDPYFYNSSTEPSCVNLFGKMITEISVKLKTVTFITNGQAENKKTAMHEVLKKVIPSIQIKDVITEQFHDRFWIDPDNNNGIVIGTSLNGIGKKIALIDNLARNDVKDIAALAYQFIYSNTL